MNKLFTLVLTTMLGAASFGQVIFESDLSSWTAGLPDGWMGSKSNIAPSNVTETMVGAEHGTSMALLKNASPDHKRFTTENLTVVGGTTYEIKMWITGTEGCELRTAFYNADADAFLYPNGYLDIFAETSGDLTMLSQTITVPATCTNGEFILSIRNTDDLVGIALDSVSIAETEPVEPTLVSIYDIQYSTVPPYISDFEGEVVTTSGIVTGLFMFGADEGRFFIQDGDGAWNGIYVYEAGTAVALGDFVEVTGTISEFFELTEITSVVGINIISSGNPMPAPAVVSTADVQLEEYEGVLVKVTGAKCINDDAGFGQFEVADGSEVARLIDDEMFSYTPVLGTYYNITGVTFLSFGDVKMYPRMLSDIEVAGSSSVAENELITAVYPNPASTILTVQVPTEAIVTIYSMTGQLIYTGTGNSKTIDVSNFSKGVYQLVVTLNDEVSTAQFSVN